jgi:hypothetical protein
MNLSIENSLFCNPNGIASSSPGLRGTSYPGLKDICDRTLKGFRRPLNQVIPLNRPESIP